MPQPEPRECLYSDSREVLAALYPAGVGMAQGGILSLHPSGAMWVGESETWVRRKVSGPPVDWR